MGFLFLDLAPPPSFLHGLRDQLLIVSLADAEEDLLILIALHLSQLDIMKLSLFPDELVIALQLNLLFLYLFVVKYRLLVILADVFPLQLADYRLMTVLSCEESVRRPFFFLPFTLRNLKG